MPAADAQLASHVPQVSQEDLSTFHEAHFSQDALTHFSSTFVRPDPAPAATPATENWTEEEEDDLGYYDDGVKRTLTDEQIEIFRHSELQQLRKALAKKAERAESRAIHDEEDSEAHDARNRSNDSQNGPQRKKRKMNKLPREPKPDLRKRTWDVVEAGLDTLDYD